MRSPDVANRVNPQDGLFTVTEQHGDGATTRLIESLARVLVAPANTAAIIKAIASSKTAIFTLTVTGKGYLARPDRTLDLENAAIADELAGGNPTTIYGFIAAGLQLRKQQGLPGLTIISCDNMAENGRLLAGLVDEFLTIHDPVLAQWCRTQCRFPATMVDRIVPATQSTDINQLEASIGIRDEAAVFTEPFRQWVIEDDFAGPRPEWEAGGAQLVKDARPF